MLKYVVCHKKHNLQYIKRVVPVRADYFFGFEFQFKNLILACLQYCKRLILLSFYIYCKFAKLIISDYLVMKNYLKQLNALL